MAPLKTAERALTAAMVALAVAIGAVHFSLDYVLYRGYFFFSTLSRLFVLNAVVFILLAGLVIIGLKAPLLWRVLLDVALFFCAADTILGWFYLRRANPRGLGHIAVALEAALIVAVIAHVLLLERGMWRAVVAQRRR
ncbi:MAG TPA: hypothetical protein VFS62_16040 [Chloroflexota bacterium]|nr:hypothetical protein [Chloroflexota bacterium]